MKKLRTKKDSRGEISAIRVASWPDGFSLWRTNLSYPVDEVVFEFETKSLDVKKVRPQEDFERKVVLRSSDDPIVFLLHRFLPKRGRPLSHISIWPHLRWVMAELGLCEVGQSPLPFGENLEALPTPSVDDPYIGRFRGRTVEEVQRDFSELDEVVKHLPYEESSQILPSLFSDTTCLWSVRKVGRSGSAADPRTWKPAYSAVVQGGRGLDGRVRRRDLCNDFVPYDKPSDLLRWMMGEELDLESGYQISRLRSWYVFPEDWIEPWWAKNTKVGRLDLHDDEADLLRLLGEDLPFLWDNSRLLSWASEREDG